ncbi:MAG TPA: excalibur calcium-binding domain-containing protein [Tahibacter sp.]|nr:excalibur calcium-binding domain-containing protein [Tahibacter sp.]
MAILLLAVATYIVTRDKVPNDVITLTSPARGVATPQEEAPRASYECDGRTHCSQMRSCGEAKYFLAHCPNTKMDGDRDGVPCENQWCS